MQSQKTQTITEAVNKAINILRESVGDFEAFKRAFVLLSYKRINSLHLNAEDELSPEYNWSYLLKLRPDQVFNQIESNLLSFCPDINAVEAVEEVNVSNFSSDISPETQKEFISVFNDIDLSGENYSNQELNIALNTLSTSKEIKEILYGAQTPQCLTNLIMNLIDPAEVAAYYDPFNNVYDNSFEVGHSVLFYQNDKVSWALNYLLSIMTGDSFLPWDDWDMELYLLELDLIFCNPILHYLSKNVSDISMEEYLIKTLKNQIESLGDYGRMVFVLPLAYLSNDGRFKETRKSLIEKDDIEAVIQLPEQIFQPLTSLSTALLIINKAKPKDRKNKIAFITVKPSPNEQTDTISDSEIKRITNTYKNFKSNIGTDLIAILEDIQKNKFNLSPKLYIDGFLNELTKGRKLDKPLCEVVRGEKWISGNYGNLLFISTRDLAKDVIEPYLDGNKIIATAMERDFPKARNAMPKHLTTMLDLEEPAVASTSIKKKCILVSLIGNNLKPTIFDPEQAFENIPTNYSQKYSGIILDHNLVAIIPNEELIDFEYLYYQLYSTLVKKQYEAMLKGAGIPNINLSNLKSIVITVPESLEDQRIFVKQQKSLLLEAENARHEAFKERLRLKGEKYAEEFQIVSQLRHSLKKRIGWIDTNVDFLNKFIQMKGLDNEELRTGQLVKDEVSETIVYLDQMRDIIDSIRDLVTKQLEPKNYKSVDVCKLFKEKIFPPYSNRNFKINFSCPDEIKADLHEISFIEAIINIINNAEEHGFTSEKTGNKIFFWVNDSDHEIVIDYANNGAPFPSDIRENDFLKFGVQGRHSNGTGLGGAYVKLMLDAHDARFEIIRRPKTYWTFDKSDITSNEDREFLKYGTYFRLTIPKRRHDEKEE